MDRRLNFTLWYFLIGFGLVLILQNVFDRRHVETISYGAFKQALAAGEINNLAIDQEAIRGTIRSRFLLKKGEGETTSRISASEEWHDFVTVRVADPELSVRLDAAKVDYRGVVESTTFSRLLSWLLPIVVMVAIWQFMLGRMGHGGHGMMNIGKSKARVYVDKDILVSFKDVAGVDEAVEELREVVTFLKSPERYTRLGGRLPKGVLLVGPPGTGKTLLARAVAGEAKVPFFCLSGSEFVEMFVGVGAARVRDLFEQAQKQAPCIIFIDELDALGRARGLAQIGGNEEREQTLNQLLTEMDGFDSSKGVVLMAATNRPEILDPALLRAGRFDRHVVVDRPDVTGREAILRLHLDKIRAAEDLDAHLIAVRTPGFVGADLANIVNEAALLAARANKDLVSKADFEEAIDRLMGGLQKKSSLMTPNEKARVAHHEAGHALVAMLVEHADPVHKISIIPRGIAALGYTVQLPAEDRHLYRQVELMDRLAVLLGGRVAEEVCFGDLSTGAADDLQKATQLARRLILEFGMSAELGPVAFANPSSPFLANPFENPRGEYSEAVARQIDTEVIALIRATHQRVMQLLHTNEALLRSLAGTLIEEESMDGERLRTLIASHQTPATALVATR